MQQKNCPERRGVFDGFWHYEDELVKVNGNWLFKKRKIYNEGRDEWAYKGGKNPAWQLATRDVEPNSICISATARIPANFLLHSHMSPANLHMA